MFESTKKTLLDLEDAVRFLENGIFNEDKEEDVAAFINADNIISYFELHLTESMMKDKYIDVKKLAKIVLAVNDDLREA